MNLWTKALERFYTGRTLLSWWIYLRFSSNQTGVWRRTRHRFDSCFSLHVPFYCVAYWKTASISVWWLHFMIVLKGAAVHRQYLKQRALLFFWQPSQTPAFLNHAFVLMSLIFFSSVIMVTSSLTLKQNSWDAWYWIFASIFQLILADCRYRSTYFSSS